MLLKRRTNGEHRWLGGVEAAPVCDDREHECERHTIVIAEVAHKHVEEHGSGKIVEKESNEEHEGGGDERTDGKGSRVAEPVLKDSNAGTFRQRRGHFAGEK